MRHVPLTVVHAISSLAGVASPLAWPTGGVPQEIVEIQEDEGRRIIADAVKAIEDSVAKAERPEIHGELHIGATVPILAGLSKDAELVVVGCRGRRSERYRRLLGSISTGLIHHAHGPAAVVHDEVSSLRDTTRLPVVVGVDGSRASEVALALALDEASWRGVDLVALHVWSDADMSMVPGMEVSALKLAADKTLAERLAGWQERRPEVSVHRVVELEEPVRRLLDRAEEAQLLVVGSHGRGGFAGMLLGSVSTTVAQEARVPVIVARQP
jgi:nucleotide-binding universal stress UspA family protein